MNKLAHILLHKRSSTANELSDILKGVSNNKHRTVITAADMNRGFNKINKVPAATGSSDDLLKFLTDIKLKAVRALSDQ